MEQSALLNYYLMSTGQFRSEALVSDGELRVEVAKAVVRSVGRDETVLLRGDKTSFYVKDLYVTLGSRTQTVYGNYSRDSSKSDINMLKGSSYTEVVAGGVFQHSTVEGESIIGGAYTCNQVGPFMRIAAFCDFLAWGGWIEADATRVELCVLALRAYMGYAHVAGAKIYMASTFFDDWINRTETFGVLADNQVQSTVLGGVGAIVQNEM